VGRKKVLFVKVGDLVGRKKIPKRLGLVLSIGRPGLASVYDYPRSHGLATERSDPTLNEGYPYEVYWFDLENHGYVTQYQHKDMYKLDIPNDKD
jgi:hypothetical protein